MECVWCAVAGLSLSFYLSMLSMLSMLSFSLSWMPSFETLKPVRRRETKSLSLVFFATVLRTQGSRPSKTLESSFTSRSSVKIWFMMIDILFVSRDLFCLFQVGLERKKIFQQTPTTFSTTRVRPARARVADHDCVAFDEERRKQPRSAAAPATGV